MLDAHPAIGERKKLSKHSASEQGADYDPAVIAELEELNRRYEERFGFRFVVFVNRRPTSSSQSSESASNARASKSSPPH